MTRPYLRWPLCLRSTPTTCHSLWHTTYSHNDVLHFQNSWFSTWCILLSITAEHWPLLVDEPLGSSLHLLYHLKPFKGLKLNRSALLLQLLSLQGSKTPFKKKEKKKWSISTRLFSIKTKDHDPGNTLHSDSSFIFVLFFLKEPDLLLQFVLLPLSESVKWGHGHAKDSVELLWWEVTLWKQKCQDKIVKKSEEIY